MRFIQGFKDFIMRGNVVELAVAVAIGTAFTALIKQFGDSFINPLLKVLGGGGDLGATFKIRDATFDVGAFINATITFLITAAAIYFFIIAPMNAYMERRRRGEEPQPAEPSTVELLTEIRDLLQQRQP